MSLENLLTPLTGKVWSNINCESVNTNGLNLNNNGITGVSSINGMPLPPFTFDFNSTSIIYRPGGPLVNDSNIVNTWAAVLVKATQINVNQILNIYFDDSVVSPCPITISYDFQGRTNFLSVQSNYNTFTFVQINDGVLISNILSVKGSVQLNCQSITGPNLAFNDSSVLTITDFATVVGTGDSIVPALELNNSSMYVMIQNFSSVGFGNPSNSFFNLTNNGFVVVTLLTEGFINQNAVSGDGTSSLLYLYDASSFQIFSNTGLLGSTSYQPFDEAQGVGYDDTIAPTFGSTNVQGALDSLKTNGLNTSGNIICNTVSPTNQTRIQYTSNTFMTFNAGMGNSAYTQWNVPVFSVGGITCDGTTFTVPNTGLYLVETQNDWDTTPAADVTVRELGVNYLNAGLFYGVSSIPSNPTNRVRMATSTVLQLNAG